MLVWLPEQSEVLYYVMVVPTWCVAGGCVDPEEMVEAAEGHIVLKKVLNIVFLVVGTLLFLAVVAVIIVTAYGEFGGVDTQPSRYQRNCVAEANCLTSQN